VTKYSNGVPWLLQNIGYQVVKDKILINERQEESLVVNEMDLRYAINAMFPERGRRQTKIKNNSFIEKHAREIFNTLSSENLKSAYANALKASLTIDYSNSEKPNTKSADDLSSQFGFSIDIQKDWFLILGKRDAKIFLSEIGYPVKSNFDQIFNRDRYYSVFNKFPVRFRKNAMVLTYAEWLQLVNFPFEPDFPKFLELYVN
jgi:hypothetical protein